MTIQLIKSLQKDVCLSIIQYTGDYDRKYPLPIIIVKDRAATNYTKRGGVCSR